MKKLIILAILALTFSSCSDFIEEDNRSFADAESTYTTEAGFNGLVNANYADLRAIYGDDAYVFCAGTDLYAVGQGRGSEPLGLSQYSQLNSSSEDVDQLYNSCYKSIQRSNTALYYSDLVEDASGVNALIGEVKYLRANAYFLLVQTYGGIAITDYINTAILEFNRNSAEEVYQFIISDLEDALTKVGTGSYSGRVNKKAVQHLLAKVHLTRAYESFADASDFSKAASYADDAIGGQSLNVAFKDLWTPGEEIKAETIFSVQYSENSISPNTSPVDIRNSQAYFFGPYMGGADVNGKAPQRSYDLIATDFALELFEEDDKRYEATFMTEVYDEYYKYFTVADNTNTPVAFYYAPKWASSPADILAYAATHPNTIIFEYGTYGAGGVSGDFETIAVKKFDDPTAVYGIDLSNRDIVLSRLGETYLIAAEAYLNTNKATGLNRLNAVRSRAGLTTPLTDYDIDVVLDERARELFGEYHRWFDLKRTGKLVERASLHNYLVDAANFNGSNGELKILRPIPQSALDLNQNKNFAQNPAYE